MAINMVLQMGTAMAENTKIQCLANDLVRRMLTTSELEEDKTRNAVVDQYAQMMVNSGYGLEQVRKVLINGLT
jgi:hypothetical protein